MVFCTAPGHLFWKCKVMREHFSRADSAACEQLEFLPTAA